MTEPSDPSDPSSDESGTILDALGASHFRDVLHRYGDVLRARRKGIDKLNVYPVPDGDTGTNMSLTVQSVLSELRSAAADDMASISKAISRGATLGARGNSGAILAQVLRGVADSVKEKSSIGPEDVAEALEKARKSAYESVLKPVEGTILTVVTAAATAARKSADEGHKLKEQLDHVRFASAEALARTPELLPVLKQAGVVDAGGSGFLLFVDALRYVATGEPIPGVNDADDSDDIPSTHAGEPDVGDQRYEVMFLLEGSDEGIRSFREKWGEIGDSIVVVGGDGTWNCHIHTNEIGKAIEFSLDFGRPREIRVTDLFEQVSAEHQADEGHVGTAVVAVVSGHGLAETYRSMGASRIVTGGQSSNPSVAELLSAVESAPSDAVIILPNNKNVRAAAEQVGELTEKMVVVVPTTSPVQGLATLVTFSSADDIRANFDRMVDASGAVKSAEVTQAVRNALSEAGPIENGDWLGVVEGRIAVVEKSMQSVVLAVVGQLLTAEVEILTVVEGQGATSEVTSALRDWVTENTPDVEVEVHVGQQALYPYLLGAE